MAEPLFLSPARGLEGSQPSGEEYNLSSQAETDPEDLTAEGLNQPYS